TEFNWSSAAASEAWQTGGNWSASDVPDYLSVVNVGHVAGAHQQVTVTTTDAKAFEVEVAGGDAGQTIELRLETNSKLTTYSGVTVEQRGQITLDDAMLDAQYVDIRPGGTFAGSGYI